LSRRAFVFTLCLTLVCIGVFYRYPEIDLVVSHAIADALGGQFLGASGAAKTARGFFYVLPIGVCLVFVALWLLGPKRVRPDRVPSSRAILFLALTMLIGPGIIVNLVLKDHWHRPRPISTTEFGGPHAFRPPFTRDGACDKNCSFVSGEAASAFWLLAPASLAPPPYNVAAIAAALAVGVTTSALRMAFGAHFLSDVLFAGLFTLLLLQIMHAIIMPGLRGRGR
jgi:lipid A 4'-phosphatase